MVKAKRYDLTEAADDANLESGTMHDKMLAELTSHHQLQALEFAPGPRSIRRDLRRLQYALQDVATYWLTVGGMLWK